MAATINPMPILRIRRPVASGAGSGAAGAGGGAGTARGGARRQAAAHRKRRASGRGFEGATRSALAPRWTGGSSSGRRTGWDGGAEESDSGVDGCFSGGSGSREDCCLSFAMTSSSLSVFSSRRSDGGAAGSGRGLLRRASRPHARSRRWRSRREAGRRWRQRGRRRSPGSCGAPMTDRAKRAELEESPPDAPRVSCVADAVRGRRRQAGSPGACEDAAQGATKRSVGDSGTSRSGHLFCWEASTDGGASPSAVGGDGRRLEGEGDGGEEESDGADPPLDRRRERRERARVGLEPDRDAPLTRSSTSRISS